MKTKSFISKSLHILVILCFFLPFFPQGCDEPSQKEKEAEKAKQDSIKSFESIAGNDSANMDRKIMDSILKSDSVSANNKIAKEVTVDTLKNKPVETKKENASSNENGNLTDKLINKWSFLKILLRPGGNYSGIGYLIDSILPFVVYCGIFISFILLITGLFFKYFNLSKKYLINGIFHIIGIIFLLLTRSMLSSEKLWGFWVCIILWIILGIIDWFFAIKKLNKFFF